MTLTRSIVLALLAAGAADSPAFEEPFKDKLRPGWSWVREDKDAWKVADGTLQIRATPGNIGGGENNARTPLLRDPPKDAKAFVAEVTVAHTPITFGEQAGLLFYRDDDNYV